ncbi:MAG: ferrochelatase [Methylococcales bacterium]|nr:ferrochelatase [Methylococcales bacterium]
MADKKIGILLANLGSPTAPTVSAVRQFLKEFLGDRRVVNVPRPVWRVILHGFILPFRPRKSAQAYAKIWDAQKGSPLTFYTRQLSEKVAAKLSSQNVVVDYVMTYGEPSMKTRLQQFKEQGVNEIIILPLYPQYSSTTAAPVYDTLTSELNSWWHLPSFRFISDYHQNERYISALAESIETAWREKPKNELLIMSFHGLPEMLTKKGDPYFYQCQKTAQLLADKLGLQANEWRLVFQSRFGKAEWLKPYCVDTLQALPKEGVKNVDLVCPGFAVDCLETLEEIAMENKTVFHEAGGENYRYIPALNDSDSNVEVMLDILNLENFKETK